jgi:PAS domain S-box-containing protein
MLLLLAIWSQRSVKRAKQQARNAQETSRHLIAFFSNAPVEMYRKDLQGRYLHINNQFEKLFGVKNADVVGKFPCDVHYSELSKSTRAHDCEVISSGKVVIREGFARTSIGHRYLHTVKFPITGECGNVTSIGAVVTDVTPMREMTQLLRKTNQQLSAILDNAPVGIFLKDGEGRFTIANRMICKYLGYPEEEIIGRKVEDLYRGEYLDLYRSSDKKIAETKLPISYESRTIADGPVLDVEIFKFPILDEAGEVIGIGGIEVDITDHKLSQRELLVAKEEADQANRSKSDFLANMSHEIRTPLNAILGFSDILTSEVFGPIGSDRYRDYARDIFQSGSHLLDLISDILDLSKIEAGRLDLSVDDVDLNEAIQASFSVVSALADEKGVALSLAKDVNAVILADRRAVQQILINLMSNAVKFTPAHGDVVVSVQNHESGSIEIKVQDTGIGIASEDLDIVFDAFTQGKSSETNIYPGSGIGLAIVKQLCDAMKWKIVLESELKKGTLVSLFLPPDSVKTPNLET